MKNQRALIFGLFFTTLIAGCGDKSLKPTSQIEFEKEIRRLSAELSSQTPGTRNHALAYQALEDFWADKKRNMSRVDRWVCIYSNSNPWNPKVHIENPNDTGVSKGSSEDDQYVILGAYCTDADKPLRGLEIGRGGEITINLKVSKAPNMETLYLGDVIEVSGSVQRDISGAFRVRPYELSPSYKIWIDADALRVVKKGN